jgi:hypothetical protein
MAKQCKPLLSVSHTKQSMINNNNIIIISIIIIITIYL